mmetsp:Transcript_21504/g.40182  ORF Transcript_21504/g.40182 Transcript_21504/m.40182 type:complete len:106 (+) Transcript_21504:210-527(+)
MDSPRKSAPFDIAFSGSSGVIDRTLYPALQIVSLDVSAWVVWPILTSNFCVRGKREHSCFIRLAIGFARVLTRRPASFVMGRAATIFVSTRSSHTEQAKEDDQQN